MFFFISFYFSVPELLVLNDCDIDRAGEPEDLKKKVYPVKELDLAQNKLENWNEVFCILSHMPRVEFVNLSLNRLSGPVEPPIELGMNKLRSLVLNNTRLEWESVESLLNFLPALEELHLSLNDYTSVLIDTDDDYLLDMDDETTVCNCSVNETTTTATVTATDEEQQPSGSNDEHQKQTVDKDEDNLFKRSDSVSSNYKKTNPHPGVKMLHFTGNPVKDWYEICRLGRVFPNLESLVLAECPLKGVEEIPKPQSSSSQDSSSAANNSTTSTDQNSNNRDPPHSHFQ